MYTYAVYMLLSINIISVAYLHNDLSYKIPDNTRTHLTLAFPRVSYLWGVICTYEINLNLFQTKQYCQKNISFQGFSDFFLMHIWGFFSCKDLFILLCPVFF